MPTGPWFQLMRSGDFDVVVEVNCNGLVNPVLDTQKYLPHDVFVENYGGYSDPEEVDIYNKMLHETDFAKQRALMRAYETLSSIPRRTSSRCCGGTGKFRSGPTCMAGRSVRATTSIRTCPTSGWTSDQQPS